MRKLINDKISSLAVGYDTNKRDFSYVKLDVEMIKLNIGLDENGNLIPR